ncbi:MAG: hypothetical protein U9Q82_14250 [Chloroflexota bacterium]|nr:hypothetical protein [Chloroflexota bacterium]
MNQIRHFTQAYTQTPWRKQLQAMGIFLIALVIILLAASVFVSITARTAAVGRKIQQHRYEIEFLERQIADSKSKLASLTSVSVMEERAVEIGFRPATSDDITYIKVPGYGGRHPVNLAPPSQPTEVTAPALSSAFTQSWVDWLVQNFRNPVVPIADVMP